MVFVFLFLTYFTQMTISRSIHISANATVLLLLKLSSIPLCICVFAMLCLVAQLCHTLCDPWSVAHQAPLSMGILQARILEWGAMPYSRDLPNPGIEPRSPTLQEDSLPSEPRNTGVGSLSLLQGIFPTQESNWYLLHCR